MLFLTVNVFQNSANSNIAFIFWYLDQELINEIEILPTAMKIGISIIKKKDHLSAKIK